MSTEIEIIDEVDCQQAMHSIRSDALPERFLVLGHPDSSPNQMHLVGVGIDTSEITTYLNDEQILYILARYDTTFDMSIAVKFVLIRWVGNNVPAVLKGKYRVVTGSIYSWIGQKHLLVETSSEDDLTDESILAKLNENTGSISKVRDNTDGHQERGFTATQVPQRTTKTFSPLTSSYTSTKQDIEIDEEVLAALRAVQHDMDPTTWFIAQYDDGRIKPPLRKVADGRQDLMEFKSNLDPEQVMYGYYRVLDIVDEIQTHKFVFIMWVGPDVKPIVKAKVSTHRGSVENAFKPVHTAIVASELGDISDRIVNDKVMGASGSKMNVK